MSVVKSFKVFLNTLSDYCTENNYPYKSNVSFSLNSSIQLTNPHNKFLVSLSDMVLPVSWSQISSYFGNNIIYYTVNSVSYNYTIPDGSYSAYNIVSQLTGNLNGITITYSQITNKFTFAHTTYDFTIDFTQSKCYQELGFYNNIIYSSSSKSLSSAIPIDLSGSREVYISCNNLTVNNIDSRNGNIVSHIIDHIPIDVGNYDILKYTNSTLFKTAIIDNIIDSFDIILYDDENYVIPILHNWSMTLEFTEVEVIRNIDYQKINQIQQQTNNNIQDGELINYDEL